ncbi:MAG: AbrB/MazE/SpoVT family DNA-binding domain-containing protein [Candidatus Omnitrophica bacterium]|nr:AbrB/MazE/SpoVT family DNA-binding domain-containing protein [Candidatus Omnitrophota bacterium]MBU1932729.1 AbrB/MazE/SpoVT family DNA-binding domain-containing protein [Candidatus Omnitrophota bacterium]
MTIIETAKITSKGQITIPSQVRKILHLEKGSSVVFGLGKDGIILLPCKVVAETPYTPKELKKIEKIIAEKGKIYRTPKRAKRHIKSL